jgi:hypothetical protein
VDTEEWSTAQRRLARASSRPPIVTRLGGLGPRLVRRLRSRARYRRWQRTGEYLPMTLTEGVLPVTNAAGTR